MKLILMFVNVRVKSKLVLVTPLMLYIYQLPTLNFMDIINATYMYLNGAKEY